MHTLKEVLPHVQVKPTIQTGKISKHFPNTVTIIQNKGKEKKNITNRKEHLLMYHAGYIARFHFLQDLFTVSVSVP